MLTHVNTQHRHVNIDIFITLASWCIPKPLICIFLINLVLGLKKTKCKKKTNTFSNILFCLTNQWQFLKKLYINMGKISILTHLTIHIWTLILLNFVWDSFTQFFFFLSTVFHRKCNSNKTKKYNISWRWYFFPLNKFYRIVVKVGN